MHRNFFEHFDVLEVEKASCGAQHTYFQIKQVKILQDNRDLNPSFTFIDHILPNQSSIMNGYEDILKFRIFSQNLGVGEAQIWASVGKMSNLYGFIYFI